MLVAPLICSKMMNHTDEKETLSKQSEVNVRLEMEIQNQTQKIIDMEHKHSESIDSMKRSMMLESLDMIKKLLSQRDTMCDECHKGVYHTLKEEITKHTFFLRQISWEFGVVFGA
ncbi:hypothetical protein Fmac_017252 [Flemingia macrophylla]|uniref:Uncharacterized protein n=1 Tax=Flemingia macrophylla TaxID=520843 RepID=A0ABD1M1T0_9FABA